MNQQVLDITPVVAALDRYIISTLDNGYLEEVQTVADLISARIALVSTYLGMTSKEPPTKARTLPVRKNGQPLYAER
jgi:hypothetical protein